MDELKTDLNQSIYHGFFHFYSKTILCEINKKEDIKV